MASEYFYIVNDYFATGEGRTISILITRAYPLYSDYKIYPSEENDWKGELKYSRAAIALREFGETFDPYFAASAIVLEKEKFLERFKNLIPEAALKMLDSDAGNFKFAQEFHYNFS